ncbi:MAG: transporter substrate-binding protein [Bacillota bacterium]|jgi:putative lysine transport system substrate-binding protein|nr:transporter substrate-binding protein [Bacillota bacterium]
MKKAISIILLILLVSSVCFGLIACGSSGSDPVSTDGQEGESPEKVLRVGMECAYAPFNWTQPDDSNGAVPISGTNDYAYGYDVMVAKKVAESMGAKLEVYKIEWDGLIPALQSDKIDAVIAGMCITEERSMSIDFSDVYYKAGIVAITTKGNAFEGAKSLAELSGARVTSQLNSVWYDMIDQIPGVKKTTALDTVPNVIVSLTSGKSDAVVVDMPTAIAAQYSNSDIVILDLSGGDFKVEPGDVNMGIGVKKGNTELLDAVNAAVSNFTEADIEAMMDEAVAKQPLAQ